MSNFIEWGVIFSDDHAKIGGLTVNLDHKLKDVKKLLHFHNIATLYKKQDIIDLVEKTMKIKNDSTRDQVATLEHEISMLKKCN